MAAKDTVKVRFMPQNLITTVPRGITVLETMRRVDLTISAPCGGNGTCGKCRIKLLEGESSITGINSCHMSLSPCNAQEQRLLTQSERADGVRLACQASILADVMLEIPLRGSEPIVIAKEIIEPSVVVKPAVRFIKLNHFLQLNEELPKYIQRYLGQRYSLSALTSNVENLQKLLPEILAHDCYAAVRQEFEVLDILSDNICLGVAADIGTTTQAVYLCDLNNGSVLHTVSRTNPQSVYGADVMSRISYQQGNPVRLAQLNHMVIKALNEMIYEACVKTGNNIVNVMDMVAVCNPTMLHLFLGLAPDRLGVRPFTPLISNAVDVNTSALGLTINPKAYVHCLSGLSGFVGSDVIADVLALQDWFKDDGSVLLLDIGTNGEIVLKHGNTWLAAACATGPALEGAQISCGTQAVASAVEHLLIAPDTLEVKIKLIGNDNWLTPDPALPLPVAGICGSGIIDAVSQLYQAGLLEANGRFSKHSSSRRLVLSTKGVPRFVLFNAEENTNGTEISVTQADIRAVQAAKGALYAGCRLLMQKAGLSQVDRVLVAGAFGQHIDVAAACVIGLFPVQNFANVAYTGNSAGTGALMALFNTDERLVAQKFSQLIQYVELSEEPGFTAAFMAGMAFPPLPR